MATKRCYSCGKEKDLERDFDTNRTRPDGHSSLCKDCKSAYNALHYQKHGDKHKTSRAARRATARIVARQMALEYLDNHPCVDCSEADVVVLEFDHQGDKTMDVSRMIQAGYSWKRILAEIEKCDVVCGNDHKRRTARTRGSYRLPALLLPSPVQS